MTNHSETAMRIFVICGNSVWKSSKIFLNAGTILIMMKVKMPMAKETTVIG